MTQHAISRTAVIILGVVMILFGIYHFLKPDTLIVFVPDFLPGKKLLVYVVGLAFVLTGVAFMAHKFVMLAGYVLAVLLIIFVLTIHLPNWLNAGDSGESTKAFVNILKDTALAAFAMYIGSESRNLPE